jgi:hypothetical protein
MDSENAIHAVIAWCEVHGIRVLESSLPADKAGEFTGLLVVMNRDYEPEQRLFYLTHAIGSIVLWSRNRDAVRQMFDELRDAKANRNQSPTRLKQAIERYRAFEIESSELAVQLLHECGCSDRIPSYTNFMRADLEAMTEFHRVGRAPDWRQFFEKWNQDIAAGHRRVEPFPAQPIPKFQPVEFEKQEILQR